MVDFDFSVICQRRAERRLKWNWAVADWEGYRRAVDLTISEAQRQTATWSLEKRVSALEGAMLAAAKTHIGMIRVNAPGREWVTPEILAKIRVRNTLGRNLEDNRAAWLTACRDVRKLINETKQKVWREFVESLAGQTSSAKAWGVVKSLSGKAPSGAAQNEVLVHGGREFRTPLRKADAFVQQYAAVSRHKLSGFERKREREVKCKLSLEGKREGPKGEECADFSVREFEAALDASKTRGAEGPDGICPRFLKGLGQVARGFALECLNQSWMEGKCPQSWRNAVIVPILKGGKPAGCIDSYRPISLTSCFGKLLERMIANRLKHLAESLGLWVDEQAGFRGLRSTEDQVLRISQAISDGFQQRPKAHRTVLALLDFSKAYDTVWRADLLGALLSSGIPAHYVWWIRGFLTNRMARVRLNGAMSGPRLFRQGLPQGSVLSPLLFLFYINSLRDRLPAGIEVSFYADDVAIWAGHPKKEVAASLVEAGVQTVLMWSREKKLSLNLSKCEVSFFSTDNRESQWVPEVVVNGDRLRFNQNPVFLGVMYDRSLSFVPQARKVAVDVSRGSRLLGAVSGREWGWSKPTLCRLYQSLFLSRMRYGASAWQPWLSKTGVAILDSAQNRCLRAITGQYVSTPVEALRLEAGFPSINCLRRREAAIALERSFRLPGSWIRAKVASRDVRQRLKIRSSWRELAKEVVCSVDLEVHQRLPLPPPTSAPWLWGRGRWSVSLSLRAGTGCSNSPEARLADATDTIRSYGQPDYYIFTDGSAEGGARCGGSAAVVTQGEPSALSVMEVLRSRGAAHTSSFETELEALRLALEWLARAGQFSRALVCSDSQSALACLEKGVPGKHTLWASIWQLLGEIDGDVLFQWVPGHVGLVGNELADQAAKEAADPEHPDVAGQPAAPLSFAAARAVIRAGVKDPEPSHERTRLVYECPLRALDAPRSVEVTLARLRSGHSLLLAKYRHMLGLVDSAACSRCGAEVEDLEHFLRFCPATEARRVGCFGCSRPPLSVLAGDPAAAASYLRSLRLL
jgi:ribonuclease HI